MEEKEAAEHAGDDADGEFLSGHEVAGEEIRGKNDPAAGEYGGGEEDGVVGAGAEPDDVGDEEADESDDAGGGDGRGGEEGGEGEDDEFDPFDAEAEPVGRFLAGGKEVEGAVEGPGGGEGEAGLGEQGEGIFPSTVGEAAHEPGEDGTALEDVGLENDEGGERLKESAEGDAGEEKGGDGDESTPPGKGVDEESGEDGPGEGGPGGELESEPTAFPSAGEGEGGTESGPGGDPHDVGIGHGVVEEALQEDASDGEIGPDDEGEDQAGHPDFPKNSLNGEEGGIGFVPRRGEGTEEFVPGEKPHLSPEEGEEGGGEGQEGDDDKEENGGAVGRVHSGSSPAQAPARLTTMTGRPL